MRLATRDNGTPDGELLVVSLDGTLALRAADWPNLLAAIGDWAAAGQELRRLADRIATGEGEPLDIATLRAPLPRTWQWLDGSAFQNVFGVTVPCASNVSFAASTPTSCTPDVVNTVT